MLHLTLAQFKPEIGNKKQNIDRMKTMIIDAKKQNSHLILFPELCITGYSIENQITELAEPVEGNSITTLRETCRQYSIHAVITFPELDKSGSIYNSALLIDDTGEILGVYRKIHLFDAEKKTFQRGNEIPVFNTKLGRIGIMICYDLEFPEIARILRLQKAQLILAPTANMSPYQDYQKTYVKSRSMENEIPLALCNRVGKEKDIHFFGESMVVDSFGNVVTQFDDTESMETISLDLKPLLDPKLNYINNLHPMMYKKMSDLL